MPFKGEIFLACRYLKPQKSLITLLTYISLLGPMLGVAVLIVVTSVMNGMPKQFVEAIKNYNPHILLESQKAFDNADEIIEFVEANYEVEAYPVTPLKVFLQSGNAIAPYPAKGIYPFEDRRYSQIVNPTGQVVNENFVLKPDEVLLSSISAMDNGFQIGDEIVLHSPAKYKAMINENSGPNIKRFNLNASKIFKIAGFYDVQSRKIDQRLIIMHQDTANELLSLEWGEALSVEMTLKKPDLSTSIISRMENEEWLNSYSFTPWQEMSNGVVMRIKQEKLQMTFVLFLIMGATGIGIGACIFSLVIQKTRDIGILKATGVTAGSIIMIFLGQGVFIGILGSGIGFIAGIMALEYRSQIAVFLGQFYEGMNQLQSVPMYLDPSDIQTILWGAVSICLIAATVPALIAASINPVKALHSGN